jgi:hypothetical protein
MVCMACAYAFRFFFCARLLVRAGFLSARGGGGFFLDPCFVVLFAFAVRVVGFAAVFFPAAALLVSLLSSSSLSVPASASGPRLSGPGPAWAPAFSLEKGRAKSRGIFPDVQNFGVPISQEFLVVLGHWKNGVLVILRASKMPGVGGAPDEAFSGGLTEWRNWRARRCDVVGTRFRWGASLIWAANRAPGHDG